MKICPDCGKVNTCTCLPKPFKRKKSRTEMIVEATEWWWNPIFCDFQPQKHWRKLCRWTCPVCNVSKLGEPGKLVCTTDNCGQKIALVVTSNSKQVV